MAIQIAAAALTRRRLGDWLPWLVVLLVGTVVEAADMASEWWDLPVLQFGKAAHDLVNSMIMPTVLMVVSRRWPTLFGRS